MTIRAYSPPRPALQPGSLLRSRLALLPLILAGNALFVVVLVERSAAPALALALAPVLALAFGALAAGDRSVLAFSALAVGISYRAFNRPLLGHSFFASDLLVGLALASWLAARLSGRLPPRRAARLPGEALVPFAVLCVVGIVRGHERFGQNLFGEPLRLVVYAAIALSLVELTPRKAHRGLVVVYYVGTVWMLLYMLYLVATGGSATAAADLSTGGSRYVSLTVAMYMAFALYLALLNLELASTMRERGLHATIAAIALTLVILSFGRATFVAVAVGVPIVVLSSRRARQAIAQLLPLAAPVVVVVAMLVSIAAPQVPRTLADRLNIGLVAHNTDASVQWRVAATREIMRQFHGAPLTGVGFGEGAQFTLNNSTYRITQDPHDSYVWLLAAGGLPLLAAFLLAVLVFVGGAVGRLRRSTGRERIVVLWALVSLLTFLLNVLAGPLLSTANVLVVGWTLLLLPAAMAHDVSTQDQVEERP